MQTSAVTFDDILIQPKFSKLTSRKEVDLTTDLGKDIKLTLPIISANMATVTGPAMAKAMQEAGGLGILHRFCSIEDNVKMFLDGPHLTTMQGVSIGISKKERERAEALFEVGATIFCVDVAHGAQQSVVDQVKWLRKQYKDSIYIIVGNFATPQTIKAFSEAVGITDAPNLYKVGIGPGSACTTRIKTGVGVPQLSAILSCAAEFPIIADGGMKTPGDIAKALAAGSKAVMLGGMLAGTNETPGDVFDRCDALTRGPTPYKIYKGSAASGYGNGWKTSEGVQIKVPCMGPVEPILKDIEGGLRSALTYTGASNLEEFRNNAELIVVSPLTRIENKAHGG